MFLRAPNIQELQQRNKSLWCLATRCRKINSQAVNFTARTKGLSLFLSISWHIYGFLIHNLTFYLQKSQWLYNWRHREAQQCLLLRSRVHQQGAVCLCSISYSVETSLNALLLGAAGGKRGLFLSLHPAVLCSECTHWAGTSPLFYLLKLIWKLLFFSVLGQAL